MGKIVLVSDSYIVVRGSSGWHGYYFVDPSNCWEYGDKDETQLKDAKIGQMVEFDSWFLNLTKNQLLETVKVII